jgi:hypothetical protein
MSLPRPADKYDQRWASENNRQLELHLAMTYRKGTDVELGQSERIILRSPDGTRWAVTVSDAGALTTTVVT